MKPLKGLLILVAVATMLSLAGCGAQTPTEEPQAVAPTQPAEAAPAEALSVCFVNNSTINDQGESPMRRNGCSFWSTRYQPSRLTLRGHAVDWPRGTFCASPAGVAPPAEAGTGKTGAEELDKPGTRVPASKSGGRFGGLEKELDAQPK